MRKVVIAFLLSLSLSACAGGSGQLVDLAGPVSVPDGKAVVVIGLSVPNGTGINRTRIFGYDPAVMRGDAKGMVTEIKCRQSILEDCRKKTLKAVIVDPGSYYIESIDREGRGYETDFFARHPGENFKVCRYGTCERYFFEPAAIDGETPRFSVGRNEIVYVGDLVVEEGGYGRANDEAGARLSLEKSGLANRMAVRLFEPETVVPLDMRKARP